MQFMSKAENVAYETTQRVRDTCLCLHVQQAARALEGAIRELGGHVDGCVTIQYLPEAVRRGIREVELPCVLLGDN